MFLGRLEIWIVFTALIKICRFNNLNKESGNIIMYSPDKFYNYEKSRITKTN
jgi:hypothetical protein